MDAALAQYEVKQDIAIKTAYQYLQENAPDAKSWYLTVATLESPSTLCIGKKLTAVMAMPHLMLTREKNFNFRQL